MSRNKRAFTEIELEKIKTLWESGNGTHKLAKELKCGKSLIVETLEKLNIYSIPSKRILTNDEVENIRILFKNGNSIRKISKQSGIGREIIAETLDSLNLSRTPIKIDFTQKQIDRIKQLYEEDNGLRIIAKEMDCCRSAIKRVLKGLNVVLRGPDKKREFTIEEIAKIERLYNEGLGAKKIANEMGTWRGLIKEILQNLGIYDPDRKPLIKIITPTERKCQICLITLSIDNFNEREGRTGASRYAYDCLACSKKKEDIKNIKITDEQRAINEEQARLRKKEREAKRRKEDPVFHLRARLSCAIYQQLKKGGGGKNGGSITDHLPYTVKEIYKHLENNFEPWMTWENWGAYDRKTWKDDDQSTWNWQIDHIIPHSDLPYDTPDHPNLKKAWSLDNLRPLDAKTNFEDGINRTRHTKKD